MKKNLFVIGLILILALLGGCDRREKLYILNWYDYVSEDLVKEFEKEYGVKVVVDPVTSNESMYNKIETRAGKYDIVVPSEYMVERMYRDGMLLELDLSKIPNYDVNKVDEKLQELRDTHFEEQQKYAVPYFWGTLAIMYNAAKPGVKELVEEHEWAVFFDRDIIPAGVKIGMYDSSRDAIATALFYLDRSSNPESVDDLKDAEDLLVNFKYDFWGTDNIKEVIMTGNLDIALVYSGDYFDTIFYAQETGGEITFGMHVPTGRNNVWFDNLAIPVTATKVDLAHEFINFILEHDNAVENAAYVGYCPTYQDVYESLIEDEELKEIVLHPGFHPGNIENAEVYLLLDREIAMKMDDILTKARSK